MFKAIRIIRKLKNEYHDTFMGFADVSNVDTEILKKLNNKIQCLDELLELLYKERN
jgi:translation initiation factor 2 alpha subunit (eIF-2alpha)